MRFAYPPFLSDVLVVVEPFLGRRGRPYGHMARHDMTADLTIEMLREIRDGIGALRADFDARLDQTNQRLGRVEHGLDDLGKLMRQIVLDQAKHERCHAHHVERFEDDVANLKHHIERLGKSADMVEPRDPKTRNAWCAPGCQVILKPPSRQSAAPAGTRSLHEALLSG